MQYYIDMILLKNIMIKHLCIYNLGVKIDSNFTKM
jgi:hypothetical protein